MPVGALKPLSVSAVSPHSRTMNYSCKLCIRSERVDGNNKSAIYLQVIIHRKKTVLPLPYKWDVRYFDKKSGSIIKREKNDQEFNLVSNLISREIEKCQLIFRNALLSETDLNTESFKKLYNNYESRESFVKYFRDKLHDRYNKGIIENRTFRNTKSTIATLEEFNAAITFNEVDSNFLTSFEAWMRNKKQYSINTIWGKMRDIGTYLKIAREEDININKDYLRYKNVTPQNRIIFLTENELDRFMQLYKEGVLAESQRNTLQAFLFACYTGIRVSDWGRVHWNMVNENWLVFQPYKNRRFEKTLRLPLSQTAISLTANKRGKMLNVMSDQYMNRILKDLAERAEIHKDITTHVARHSFATRCIRKKVPIEVLQQYMGHSRIEKTMIYLHLEDSTLQENMKLLD